MRFFNWTDPFSFLASFIQTFQFLKVQSKIFFKYNYKYFDAFLDLQHEKCMRFYNEFSIFLFSIYSTNFTVI